MTQKVLPEKDNREHVILVHGTFAGDLSDTGTNWWQKDSETWRTFQSLLPQQIILSDVFHWGAGPNSYRARVSAGQQLLDHLLQFERDNISYHLVGHSHGGSVIWECLRLATYARVWEGRLKDDVDIYRLRNLRSWTTVGTPFIDFATNFQVRKRVTIETSFKNFSWRAKYPDLLRRLNRMGVYMFAPVVWLFFLGALIFPLVMGLTIYLNIAGWSSEPTAVKVLTPIIGMIFMFVYTLVAGGWVLRKTETSQIGMERLSTANALQNFGPKWLGIYSKDDEAIAALAVSVGMRLNVMQKREDVSPVFYSDRQLMPVQMLRKAVYAIYNKVVPRFGNRFISRQLSKAIQGNDRPGAAAFAVRPHPGWEGEYSAPLPNAISNKLLNLANSKAADVIPELRSLLYSFDASSIRLSTDSDVDATAALVHNSYFNVKEIVQLIVCHILVSSTQEADVQNIEPSLRLWIAESKKSFSKLIGTYPPVFEDS